MRRSPGVLDPARAVLRLSRSVNWPFGCLSRRRLAAIPKEFRDKRSKLSGKFGAASKRRVAALSVFEKSLPDVGRRNLKTLLEKLEGMLPAAAWVYEQDGYDAISSTKSGFDKWLKDVGDPERGLYDQSDVMINAMDGVLGHTDSVDHPELGMTRKRHVQSGHHWEVAAQADKHETRDLLLRSDDYRAMLVQDMKMRRETGQLERVLEVMAENEGGRLLLTGGQDSDFIMALTQVAKGETVAMLRRVEAKVITPYKLGSESPEMALKIAMRNRGFYM